MKRWAILRRSVCIAVMLANPVAAQNFTTQDEVTPILEMTRAHWIAIGAQNAQDLLYFTHLLSWRCGIAEIRYGLNNAAPETVLAMEPCHRDSNQPNAIRVLPFVPYPLNSIEAVTVELVFDDGARMQESFTREQVGLD